MVKAYKCICCNKRAKPKDRRPLTDTVKNYLRRVFPAVDPTDSDVICFQCRVKSYKNAPKPRQCSDNISNDPDYQPQPSTSRQPFSPLSIRWVVESANARIKGFKYLDHVMPNSQLPFIGDFVKIVCAISNKYFPPLSSPDQVEQDELIAEKMLQQNEKENELKMLVEEKGLARKKTIWRPIEDCEVQGFPRLSDEQLSELTLGVYQLRLSSSYMQEHTTGNCDIKVHVHEQSLISAKLQSRHTSSRMYMLWIRHSEDMVESWYCQCKTGSRVVGMCSHIAAVVWFLSAGRYQQKESLGVRDWGKYLSDASAIRIDDSSSSESDSEVF
ncbi:uncharacterized protein LOC127845698 isoform X2 [Dreissena polymorpha]|uniref:SWIM-type domain-containing protein n=2 Tax=Dreissena polymorpha TaxID=45954 RepID=A0A9D4IJJ2_DREPO|nr:uncharacterized protein LOC127845698 isoform X2 [Dreissena polymorpha]XP_052232750.1 uncharacterized protein LOC127845698 isoform X2 [Dreissena polymorpha]KAH3777951.1 hypothetical protein DPMN_179402 [Dreissena polymorpha]